MRGKKKISRCIAVIAALVLMGTTTGCDNKKVNVTREPDSQSVSKEKTEEKDKEAGDLKMVDGGGLRYNDENGLYYIFGDKDGVGEPNPTIKFIDFATGKEVYLCNKLNCVQQPGICMAVLPDESRYGYLQLFGDDDYIYLYIGNCGSSDSMSTSWVKPGWEHILEENVYDVATPTIYRMNKDGTGREKVFEFDSELKLGETFLSDGKYLYIEAMKNKSTTEKADDKGNYITMTECYDKQIIRIDLDKKSIEKLIDLEDGQRIFDCGGRNIIIYDVDYGQEVTAEFKYKNPAEYDKLYENATEVYSLYNLDSGKSTPLKELKRPELNNICVADGYFYVNYKNKKYIEKIDLRTNQITKIEIGKNVQISSFAITREDGPDMLQCYVKEDNRNVYYLNSETGEIVKNTLRNNYDEDIDIISQNKKYMLVRSGYKRVKNENKEDSDKYRTIENYYSVISIEDYLNNNPNYISVDMIYSGNTTNLY